MSKFVDSGSTSLCSVGSCMVSLMKMKAHKKHNIIYVIINSLFLKKIKEKDGGFYKNWNQP